MEKLVTNKIENEVSDISGFSYSTSDSRNSLSLVVARLENDADIDKAWTELRQKMDDLQAELPEGCQKISVETDLAATAGIIMSISGENRTYEELAELAESFGNELKKIEGVSRFDVEGKQDKEAVVEVDYKKLNRFGFSLSDVAGAIGMQNAEIPSGSISDGYAKIGVRAGRGFSSLEDLENIILGVSADNGSVVRLKDVAYISMQLEESSYRVKHNGRNAVLLAGYFKDNRNILIAGREVEKKIDEFVASVPGDITVDKVLYQPEDVSEAINSFSINLAEGMLFVVIVVLIGMSIRNAIVISTAIPLSILFTFCTLNIIGIKIHQISITALIIALGMLVDNAIVISDAIQVRLDNGQERLRACVEGPREVAVPVLTSTLTTVAAFIPLLLLPSTAGEYIRSIPQIVMLSLSFSYGVAMLFTPIMAYLFFKKSAKKEKIFKTREFFKLLLETGLKRKKLFIFASAAAVGVSILIAGYLGLQFFPKADKDMVYIDIRTESSVDISRTEQITGQVTQILSEQPEVASYTAAIGGGLPKFYITVPLYTRSTDFAQVLVRLDLKNGGRFGTNLLFADYLQSIFDKKISGGSAVVRLLEQGEPIGSPVRVRVTGSDIRRVYEAAREIEAKLYDIPGAINADNDFTRETSEYYVDVDADRASSMGVSKLDIQREISIALKGAKASVLRDGGKEYDIVVKSNVKSVQELENLAVKSSVTQNKVLVKQVAVVELQSQIQSIKKYNKDLTVMVYSDVMSGYSSAEIQGQLRKQLKEMDLQDVDVIFDGEYEKIFEYFGDIGVSAVFAAMLVYLILILQFGSLIQPLVILITIPLSVFGSVMGLLVFRQPLSFMALFGMVSLVGIVVNNAILLIDFINCERRLGTDIEKACIEAADKRFRPIMLTTVTTVIGLLPLAFTGGNLFKPMAVSLMCGLMVSTVLTLIIIPIVYSVIEGNYESYRKFRWGKGSVRLQTEPEEKSDKHFPV